MALHAKITRPRVHNVLARDRLLRKIADAPAPVVWIAASPGAGKTTLAATFVDTTGQPCLWYRADDSDRDPATFFHHIRSALAPLRPDGVASLPAAPADGAVDVGVFARHFAAALYDRLAAPAVLVIDNFQAADASFALVVRELCADVPAGFRVLVLSLEDPPPPFARLVANRGVAQIDPTELRFTLDEARPLLDPSAQLDAATLVDLHERAGGWAAGLVLLGERAGRLPAAARSAAAVAAESARVIDHYFGEVVLGDASPEDRRLLMLTAALPRVSAALAATVAAHPQAGRVLEQLCQRRLFIERLSADEPVYRYHALFRAALLARADVEVPPADRLAAQRRAAAHLEETGHVDEAVPLLLAAECWDDAARMVAAHARPFHEQGRWRTLADWIARLPVQVRGANPWLGYWAGACQLFIEPADGRRRLDQAFTRFAGVGDRNGQVLAAGAITRALLLEPDWSALDAWIDVLGTRLDGADDLPASTRMVGFTRLIYAAFARQPGHPRLAGWASHALAALAASSTDAAADPNEAVLAAFSLMNYYMWTGATTRQQDVIRLVRAALADPRVSAISRAYWRWTHANYLLRTGAPREALAEIDEALALARTHGLAIGAVIGRFRIGHLLTLGDLAAAEAAIRELADAPHVEPYLELKAWLALHRGQLLQADELARHALRLARERGRTFYATLDELLLATIAAESGDFDRAATHLEAWRAATAGVDGPLPAYQMLLIEATIALLKNDRQRCHVLLRTALPFAARAGYTSHWFWLPRAMARLYAVALQEGIEPAYVRGVIATHGLAPPDLPGVDLEHWPWAVDVRCLGAFDLTLRGERLQPMGKAQRKPIELLKVLVALGGRDVRIDRVIDALWPEPTEGDGQKAFDITVHRLRRLLGDDASVLVADRRVSLNRVVVRVDALALDVVFARLWPAGGAEPGAEALDAAEATILRLYRGPFLADEGDSAALLPLRSRLAGAFQRFVLRQGARCEAERDWPRALALYDRGIERDPVVEAFYQRRIACLMALGRYAEAMVAYRRCLQILAVVLGVSPSEETEALHRRLLALSRT